MKPRVVTVGGFCMFLKIARVTGFAHVAQSRRSLLLKENKQRLRGVVMSQQQNRKCKGNVITYYKYV